MNELIDEKIVTLDGLKHYNDTIDSELAEKQETLVSGTNIKTINNISLLGSGNITISGGNIESITDEEIGDLFEEDLLEDRYVSQESLQEAVNTEY